MSRLIALCRWLPLVPVIGNGPHHPTAATAKDEPVSALCQNLAH